MSLFWQQTIVAVFIVGCAAHLAWHGWRSLRGRKSGCGSCGSCAKPGNANLPTVVTVESLRKSADRR